ncbi:hypothetical protein D3C71_1686000 [compost metagenome]
MPPMVYRPSMKSVGAVGSGRGSQRSWFGDTAAWLKSLCSCGCSNGVNSPCITAGRMRYSQLRRLLPRGAVNAVPVSCSAYRPCATRCGELRPTGKVPGTASVANSLPKPD